MSDRWHRWRLAMRRQASLDRDLDAEVAFHLEMETARRVAAGLSPDEARTAALRAFGGVERVKEECRDTRLRRGLDSVVQDLRHGTRALARTPGYAVLAILTLGLGIGANTAVFSVVRGVLLRPLPYDHGERLVLVQQSAPGAGQADVGVSIKELYDYRQRLRSFDGLVEFHQMSFDLLERGEPDRVTVGVVSANFFDVLGIRPLHGRTFRDGDDAPGAEPVLVLSHSYWQSTFGGDPAVVGQAVVMNDRPHTIVGVLPAVPQYPQESDVYMPTSACPFRAAGERRIEQNRRAFSALTVFGQLRPGVAAARAGAEVATVAAEFAREHPDTYPPGDGFAARTTSVRDELTRNARPLLLILLGTTGLILVIACANVANLTFARMLRRDHELTLRAALGAGRTRLVRQLLTESAVVGVAGGLTGLAVAWLTLGALARFAARFTPRANEVGIDLVVLAFTGVMAVLTGVAFGTLPALTARVGHGLAVGYRQVGRGPGARRLQRALVVGQVSLAVVLLVGAGLLLTSFQRLQSVDPGYRADRVLAAEVYGNFTRYQGPAQLLRLYEPVLDRLASAPGVVSAAVTNAVPLATVAPTDSDVIIEGATADGSARRLTTDQRIASPGLYETLGIPLRRGRLFTASDRADSPPVAIINETFARQWQGRDPIGARASLDGGQTWLTVVGVVGDVRQFGLEREAPNQLYLPLAQMPFGVAGRVLVRMTGAPSSAAALIRDVVRQVDSRQTIENVRTLEEIRQGYLARPRLTALLLLVFAGLALAVTLAGVAGVIATSVSERTREFGVRMALGQSRASVLRMVLRQGLTPLALGLVLGLAGALVAGRVLSAYLFRTPPHDPTTLAFVLAVCGLTGVLACLGPARRATRVDPLTALRAE